MRTLLLIIPLLTLLSCCDHDPVNYSDDYIYLNDTTLFAYQQTRINTSEGFTITFDSVITDSRCPLNVECVWEGNAAVEFSYAGNNMDTTFVLNTYGDKLFPDTVIVGNLLFNLLLVEPYPEFPNQTSIEDYRCSLIVKKVN
ncbi:hypothetical protein ACE01N_08120 [Saccharicrinis sp. FJH2]|uniref:hypothetical protein n=1 Tax=Saccharicrinis sp. FJH65 TaxID=3344659 RepID=UPI0035F24EE1